MGVEERTIIKRGRKRKTPPVSIALPAGGEQQIPSTESDEFEPTQEEVTETWPFFEYRRLGTTLFDPKWCTPDAPEESCGYVVDVDYVNFGDLQQMREMDCYKNIPDEETLKAFFFDRMEGAAPVDRTRRHVHDAGQHGDACRRT